MFIRAAFMLSFSFLIKICEIFMKFLKEQLNKRLKCVIIIIVMEKYSEYY